jgi:beta-carotene hydroxylase
MDPPPQTAVPTKAPPQWMLYKADLRTLALLSTLSLCFTLGWFLNLDWLMLPCTILVVTACAAKHNHTHCPTFRNRSLNRVLDYSLTLMSGSSTTGIRVAHNVRHHGNNQSSEDFVRCSIVSKSATLKALLVYVPRVAWEGWQHRTSDLKSTSRKAMHRNCLTERLLLWTFIILLLTLDWSKALILFGIPWLVGQWFLIAINLPQHDNCDPNDPHSHSRNIVGRSSNWLFLNNGYHSAHHERPALHWSQLPAYHTQKIAPYLPARLSCNGLTQFWMRWWIERNRLLKSQ